MGQWRTIQRQDSAIAATLSRMNLQINGQPREFPGAVTVAALVTHLGMKADRVAVELNLEILPRGSWETTQLKDGDRLEIVHFVGGGADN
jgi:thiamine biosynthesis protein ThiS